MRDEFRNAAAVERPCMHVDAVVSSCRGLIRYGAAIAISNDFKVDNNVNTFVIPGGTVAKMEFSGSLEQADRCWTRFADHWLPASGYQFSGRFAYDHYPIEIITAGRIKQILLAITGFRATLCMPVKK